VPFSAEQFQCQSSSRVTNIDLIAVTVTPDANSAHMRSVKAVSVCSASHIMQTGYVFISYRGCCCDVNCNS